MQRREVKVLLLPGYTSNQPGVRLIDTISVISCNPRNALPVRNTRIIFTVQFEAFTHALRGRFVRARNLISMSENGETEIDLPSTMSP